MTTATDLADKAANLATEAADLAVKATALSVETQQAGGVSPFIFGITVFVLAIFVGYYVVWRVTPALHTPLMAVTNAISGIIVVGAIIALGPEGMGFSQWMGFFAVVLASINIFGGFIVTQRMLAMFKKKDGGKA